MVIMETKIMKSLCRVLRGIGLMREEDPICISQTDIDPPFTGVPRPKVYNGMIVIAGELRPATPEEIEMYSVGPPEQPKVADIG